VRETCGFSILVGQAARQAARPRVVSGLCLPSAFLFVAQASAGFSPDLRLFELDLNFVAQARASRRIQAFACPVE